MKLVRTVAVTTLLFFSLMTLSKQASALFLSDNISEEGASAGAKVRLLAHFKIGVKAPADITVWYKEKLLGNISLYGSLPQKELQWIIINPFDNEEEFQSKKKYLTVLNQFGHELPVLDFQILPF